MPASAQPVDDLIRIGDLGDAAEQFPPEGDIYFVTVMAPAQTLLSWLVGRDNPAVEFLTDEDVNGFRTPTQRRTLDLASMRTSEQVAQYVALQRLGYDVELVPGEVLIDSDGVPRGRTPTAPTASRGARPMRCSTRATGS